MKVLTLVVFIFSGAVNAADIVRPECMITAVHKGETDLWRGELAVMGDTSAYSSAGSKIEFDIDKSSRFVAIGKEDFNDNDGHTEIFTSSNKVRHAIRIEREGSPHHLKIYLYKKSNKGVMFLIEMDTKKKRMQKLVEFDCNEYKQEKRAILKGKGTVLEKFSKKQYKALPKSVRAGLESVDVPFEMGDGYYDLKKEVWFRVLDKKTRRTLGYILESHMSYTEDNDDEDEIAYTHFLANGIRFSGPVNN